jgi:hypothetical protein
MIVGNQSDHEKESYGEENKSSISRVKKTLEIWLDNCGRDWSSGSGSEGISQEAKDVMKMPKTGRTSLELLTLELEKMVLNVKTWKGSDAVSSVWNGR